MQSTSPSDTPKHPGSWYGPPFINYLDTEHQQSCHANVDLKQSSFRTGDECVSDRYVQYTSVLLKNQKFNFFRVTNSSNKHFQILEIRVCE